MLVRASNHTFSICQFVFALFTACCLLYLATAFEQLTQPVLSSVSSLHTLHRVCAIVMGLILQEFHNLVNPKTKLISLVHVSNTLGTILSTEEVVEAAQKVLHYCKLDLP